MRADKFFREVAIRQADVQLQPHVGILFHQQRGLAFRLGPCVRFHSQRNIQFVIDKDICLVESKRVILGRMSHANVSADTTIYLGPEIESDFRVLGIRVRDDIVPCLVN